MKKLTASQIALVVNALREKANGDRAAIDSAGPIGIALSLQAGQLDELVEDFENARDVAVEEG